MKMRYHRWVLIEYANTADPSIANPDLDVAIAIKVKEQLPHARRGNGECFEPSTWGFDFNLPMTSEPMPPVPEAVLNSIGSELSHKFPDYVITISQGIYSDANEGPVWDKEPPRLSWLANHLMTTTRTTETV